MDVCVSCKCEVALFTVDEMEKMQFYCKRENEFTEKSCLECKQCRLVVNGKIVAKEVIDIRDCYD